MITKMVLINNIAKIASNNPPSCACGNNKTFPTSQNNVFFYTEAKSISVHIKKCKLNLMHKVANVYMTFVCTLCKLILELHI